MPVMLEKLVPSDRSFRLTNSSCRYRPLSSGQSPYLVSPPVIVAEPTLTRQPSQASSSLMLPGATLSTVGVAPPAETTSTAESPSIVLSLSS